MDVSMVEVGVMGVLVHKECVPVPVAVGLSRMVIWTVSMSVVLVVDVAVLVFDPIVAVLVLVGLRKVKVHAGRH